MNRPPNPGDSDAMARTPDRAPADPLGQAVGFDILVPFTSTSSVRRALRDAWVCARGLDARLVVVVPVRVPYGWDIEAPPVALGVWARRLDRVLELSAHPAIAERLLCRDSEAAWDRRLMGAHLVVLAQPLNRRWRRRVRRLRERGVEVLVVPRRDRFWGLLRQRMNGSVPARTQS